RGGKLSDATAQWGLADRTGWWNSITAADIDGDGDLDLFAGNFGLNTKYHTSKEHPVTLFYGDMDGSGHDQLVEAKYEGDNLLPVRGRSCSSAAMPVLKDRFKTFRSFAGSSLEQIYTPDRLKAASKFTVSELASGILRNDGGKFTFVPLPRQAQLAPVFGCAFLDADADGNMDLLLAENFWSPQLETGRMDGDLGQLLLGNGDGTFRVLPPDQSGILVPGDAKALVLADWNRDGAPDAIFTRNNDRAVAVEGTPAPNGNHRLTLRLTGPKNNPFAVGATVSVKTPDKTRRAALCGGGGYLSQSAPYLFMGLGKADRAAEVIVTWPGGRQSVLKDVPSGMVEVAFPK
ncbi:MAG TPA: CRTAC1 family protein, partial [Verrucomicrobiales bacterium]|nr:CRTAC1 family protein [Verrucomicrobiales bacterium]